jgi:hypothetical protein
VLNPDLRVAYSKLFEGQFKQVGPRSELLKITEPGYMELRDGAATLKLFETHNSVVLPTRIMKFKSKSIFEKVLGTVRRIFNRGSEPSRLELTEFYNHDNVYELFLPEGSECTVLGKFGREGSEVVCNSPEMVFQNEKQMMRFIEQSIKSLNAVHVLLGIGFAVCLFLLLKELYSWAKSMRGRVRNIPAFGSVSKIFQKSRLCAACRKNLSCIYYLKCRHMAVCQECQG